MANVHVTLDDVSSEKTNSADHEQYAFIEVNGNIIYFNEAEAAVPKADPIYYTMSEDELSDKFGPDGYIRLPDELYFRYKFTTSKLEVEEHHVAVYAGKKDKTIVKANHPAYLLRNSLASPSLAAAFMNAKYTNGMPYYRQEKDFERYGISINRKYVA